MCLFVKGGFRVQTAFIKRFSLRSVLVINVIIPLVLAVTVISYAGLGVMEHIVEKRMQKDVELVARAIRLPVSYSLEKDRSGSVGQALESVFHIDRVYGAYVYDANGRRVAAVGAVEPEERQHDLVNVVEDGKRKGQYERVQGRRVYAYFVPLFDTAGKSNGLLKVTRKKSDFEDHIRKLRIGLSIAITGLGLLIAGMVLFGFDRAAGRYFTKLADSMIKIQTGDRSHRADADGPREIAALARSLNAMLDSMDRAEKEVMERRQAQATLEDRLRQNEKMAAVGRLAAGVAHELGAPLSLIDGKAQRCLRDADIGPVHKNSLYDIRHQVQRMSNIVRQLLDFGKGAMRHKRRIHTARLAESAVSGIRKEIGDKIAFLMRGPEPGPCLYVDPLRLEQALINLLRNAAQSKKTTKVSLNWEETANHEIILRVEDDGEGIAEEIKSKIFEPFFSTHKTVRNTGMGLSVVHGIIREHGGVIQIFDSPLGGAGFRITLPPQTEIKQTDRGENHG